MASRAIRETRLWVGRLSGWPAAAVMIGAALVVEASAPVAVAGGAQQLAQADPPLREHFEVLRPATLEPAEAEAIHRSMGRQMADRYAVSQHPVAERYIDWQRQNASPYRSATHGAHYVSQYTNAVAKNYALFEQAGTLPVGLIVAKDSFTALADGDIYPGPLFIMEKMDAGFNPPSGDWRYTMIMPDGSLFGVTKGEGAESVAFCVGCHAAVRHQDHLFFIPPPFRP